MNRGPDTDEYYYQESKVFKADTIYVILKKSCYVSRSLRIQWFLQHLNTNIRLSSPDDEEEKHSEAVIVSVVPQEPHPGWCIENSHSFEYTVDLSSNVIFLGEVYSQVYCLDISPSVSTVDIQHGAVLLDVIIKALRKSISYLVKPLLLPGSSHCYSPEIFITVIAHTPFYISPAQQVLVQGWKISEENLEEFLEAVIRQLAFIEDAVAQVSGTIHDQFEHERKESLIEQIELKKSTEALFNDTQENKFTPTSPNIAMVSPGSGFLNLLRYGMLALKLLPVSNFSNLVVITDGMIILPDTDTLDSVLNHMRYNDIACYFLHVGSQFHPNCGFGFVPYTEVMQLIAVATNGAYMQYPPLHTNGLNVYHQNFLIWSLKRKSVITDLSTPSPKEGEWTISNRNFYGNRDCQLLVKKYLENDINVSVYSALACRIREGFILKDISARDNELIITFVLPWTNHIYIEYTLSCQWPVVASSSISTHYKNNIKAPYEFLHDISCRMRVPIKSPFRQALIARFWRSLKSFAQSDFLLSHLESFMNNPSSYYLPEILKNGMPLYNLTPGSCQPTVGSSDIGFSQFGSIWRPACLLNNNLWQKWFHTDRLGIIFKHDEPLNLFPHSFSATSIQSTGMQCRQAANTLYSFLKSYCSFVLIENHSYIKFLSPNESGTGRHSFFVIRSIFKPPYAVLHIAFLYNIPGIVRSKVLEDFKYSISALKIPRISIQKDSFDMIYGSEKSNIIANTYNSQTNCCILLDKPLEKILIRYEQMPKEFKTVVFPDGTQPSPKAASQLSSSHGLITTLSRYLHHRRWIWKTSIESSIFLPSSFLATIMSTLVKIRLQEGFYFAHYSPGICSMVLEVQMKGMWKDNGKRARMINERSKEKECPYLDCNHEKGLEEEVQSCIIQYVLFSPKTVIMDKEEENNDQNIRIAELVSECWIEPQHGVVVNCPRSRNYMMNLQYQQIPDAVRCDADYWGSSGIQ
ncbi:hypothetical protein V9T40_013672 [Parthenolecanium corni]|uniref:Protein SZT2 n=1 Tax=Parthenolecanium corni TaxID=536013 RepID=A0AAN9TD71_9HEMI